MAPTVQGPLALSRATRPALTLAAALMIAVPVGGCWQSPRMQAPFTLSNPSERHPIKVSQGEALLDLSVSSRSSGLSSAQFDQLYRYLAGYQEAGRGGLTIKTPSGSANQAAAKRAYEDVRHAMRRAGISARGVRVEPYFAKYDPAAPIRLSYLELVAKGPDCPDWSENVGRDPQNLPWPNMGCATQKNLAAMVADPEDFVAPHPEMPRPSERRDVVWGKYVKGDVTGSKWAPDEKPLSEHANSTDVDDGGSGD